MEHLCNLAALLHLLILHNSRTLHGSSRTRASRSKKHAGPAFRLRLSKFLGNYQIGSIGANTSKEKSGWCWLVYLVFPAKLPSSCNEPCVVLVMLAGRGGEGRACHLEGDIVSVRFDKGSFAGGQPSPPETHCLQASWSWEKISGDLERQTVSVLN